MRVQRLSLVLLVPSLLVLAAFSLPAQAQDESPMRVRIYQPEAKARPARPDSTYRARRRYDRPKIQPAMIPVPELLPDGTPNPEWKPGAMMPAPTPAPEAAPPGTAPATPPAQRPLIALVGDSLAEALAYGMEADAAFKTEFTLKQKTVSASGLVRDDFHDWPKAIAALTRETPAPAAIVLMMGVNDRQQLRQNGEALEPLSEPWREAYKKRIEAVLGTAKAARIPVIWVGLPAMRTPRFSTELAQINDMIRNSVSMSGETFVEIYDGFADASGGFTATGPDIIGDTVRLRGPDGIHFTPAGQRKLAFFVDKPLRKRLEGLMTPASLPDNATQPPTPGPNTPGEVNAPLPAARPAIVAVPQIPARIRPDIGEIRLLAAPPSASALVGNTPPPHQDPETEALFARGIPPAPRTGRADDYRWK